MTKAERRLAKLRYIVHTEQGEKRKNAFICLMLSTDIIEAYVTLLCAHPSEAEMHHIEQTFLLDALHRGILLWIQRELHVRYWQQFNFGDAVKITPIG